MSSISIVPGWLRRWRPVDYPRRRRDLPVPNLPPPPPREQLRRAAEILRRTAGARREALNAALRQLKPERTHVD